MVLTERSTRAGGGLSKQRKNQEPLRQAAEAQLARATPANLHEHTEDKLLHELQVHQIELEMQNESLRQSEYALAESLNHYNDFYDFAPVGFITLSREVLITEINHTGTKLLGDERRNLLQRRFAPFVAPEDQDRCYRYFLLVLQHDTKQTCEMTILRHDGSHVSVQLDSIQLVKDSKVIGLRAVMTDITERKTLNLALAQSEAR